jgi:hypothetical protein
MAVYLDTNVLVQRAGLASLELSTVVALCREVQIDIVLPSLVADEIESSRLRLVEAAFDSLRASHREAARLAPVGTLQDLPNPGELAREYRRTLGQQFTIASTPSHAPEEALRREAFRLRPARGGVGARDSAIWLTIRDDHLARDESAATSCRTTAGTLRQLAAQRSFTPRLPTRYQNILLRSPFVRRSQRWSTC